MRKYTQPEFEIILLTTEPVATGTEGVSGIPTDPIGPEIPGGGGEGGGIDNPFPDDDGDGAESITWSWSD